MDPLQLLTSEGLAALVAILTLVYFFVTYQRRSRYPPGPTSLPVIGNMHQIFREGGIMQFYSKYQKMYGNVYTMQFGGDYSVVISGYDNIMFLLSKHGSVTCKRNVNNMPHTMLDIFAERPGVVFSPNWREIRQQSTRYLRDEGMGKRVLEPLILDEVDNFCDWFIEPSLGQGIEIDNPLTLATSNIIYTMLIGRRYSYSDSILLENKEMVRLLFKANLVAAITRNIPLAEYLPGDPCMQRRSREYFQKIISYFDGIVSERRKQMKAGESPELLVDHLLMSCKQGEEEMKRYDKNLASTLEQLYGAGTDTTANALSWAFLYLCSYPQVLQRVQQEIYDVVGEITPSYGQKADLPYTEAVMLETLRCSNMVVVLLPHTLEKELEVEGQKLPANTELVFNMQSVFQSCEVFDNPQEFNPERFLTGDIKLKNAYVNLVFGVGKRACLGEPLVRMEMFLILTTILQRYSITYEGETPPSLVGVCKFNNQPKPYRLIFSKRKR